MIKVCSVLIGQLLLVLASSVACAETQVWWEGWYGGKYYPGRYYSASNLCCHKDNCGMRSSILASIAARERAAVTQVAPVAYTAPPTSSMQQVTTYRTETRYRYVKVCDGRRCRMVRQAYTVQVPVVSWVRGPASVQTTSDTAVAVKAAPEPLTHVTSLDPTPQEVVDILLELVSPQPDETLIDLGCGDGRILITAARKYRVRGWGIELNPKTARLARRLAREAAVDSLVQVVEGDILEQDEYQADIVTMYLYPDLIKKAWPKIRRGALVLSVNHELPVGYAAVLHESDSCTIYGCIKR